MLISTDYNPSSILCFTTSSYFGIINCMDRANDAYILMSAGRMNCSQSVLTAYCEQFGLERSLALKLLKALRWHGRMGATCGAVTALIWCWDWRRKCGREPTPKSGQDL